jgi:hypothetical protein
VPQAAPAPPPRPATASFTLGSSHGKHIVASTHPSWLPHIICSPHRPPLHTALPPSAPTVTDSQGSEGGFYIGSAGSSHSGEHSLPDLPDVPRPGAAGSVVARATATATATAAVAAEAGAGTPRGGYAKEPPLSPSTVSSGRHGSSSSDAVERAGAGGGEGGTSFPVPAVSRAYENYDRPVPAHVRPSPSIFLSSPLPPPLSLCAVPHPPLTTHVASVFLSSL